MSSTEVSTEVRTERVGSSLLITIDRPKVLNALNMTTMQEVKTVFADLKDDADVRVVILTGAGEKSFVAGADINELSQQTPVSAKEYTHRGQAVVDAIENLVKHYQQGGTLKPAKLNLQLVPEPQGRFLFPAKLKKVPGGEKRWLDGVYLDAPEEWDDPYRYFRW